MRLFTKLKGQQIVNMCSPTQFITDTDRGGQRKCLH